MCDPQILSRARHIQILSNRLPHSLCKSRKRHTLARQLAKQPPRLRFCTRLMIHKENLASILIFTQKRQNTAVQRLRLRNNQRIITISIYAQPIGAISLIEFPLGKNITRNNIIADLTARQFCGRLLKFHTLTLIPLIFTMVEDRRLNHSFRVRK